MMAARACAHRALHRSVASASQSRPPTVAQSGGYLTAVRWSSVVSAREHSSERRSTVVAPSGGPEAPHGDAEAEPAMTDAERIAMAKGERKKRSWTGPTGEDLVDAFYDKMRRGEGKPRGPDPFGLQEAVVLPVSDATPRLRPVQWAKLDPIEKLTCIVDAQRAVDAFFNDHVALPRTTEDIEDDIDESLRKCPSPTLRTVAPVPLGGGDAVRENVPREPLRLGVSQPCMTWLGYCMSMWLRVMYDMQDITMRKRAPWADTWVDGHAHWARPLTTRLHEQFLDAVVWGYTALGDRGSQFDNVSGRRVERLVFRSADYAATTLAMPSTAPGSPDFSHTNGATAAEALLGDRMKHFYQSDHHARLILMAAFGAVTTQLFVHGNVVQVHTDCPHTAAMLRHVFGHLIQHYGCIELRTYGVAAAFDVAAQHGLAQTSSSSSSSSIPPAAADGAGGEAAAAATSTTETNAEGSDSPAGEGTTSSAETQKRNVHESLLHREGTVVTLDAMPMDTLGGASYVSAALLQNTWVLLGRNDGMTLWAIPFLVKRVARYLAENRPLVVMYPSDWKSAATFKDDVRAAMSNDACFAQITWHPIDNLEQTWGEHVMTPCVTVFASPEQKMRKPFKKALSDRMEAHGVASHQDRAAAEAKAKASFVSQRAARTSRGKAILKEAARSVESDELLRPMRVIGINVNAHDVLFQHPQLEFSCGRVGNTFRFASVQRTVLYRMFGSQSWFSGFGGGLEPNSEAKQGASRTVLRQERGSKVLQRSVLIPITHYISARVFGV